MSADLFQAAVAVATPVLIQKLKPAVQVVKASRFTRWLSALFAALTSAGITGFDVGASGATCLVVPDLSIAGAFVARAIVQYALHEVIYRTTIATKGATGENRIGN